MGMRVFFGGEFEYGHERAAFMELMGEAVARWSDEGSPYALFVDFWVDTAKIDLMAITEHALVIIDLKEVGAAGGYLTGSLNGNWIHHAPDGASHVINAGRENPFRQIEGYRQTMIGWLRGQAAAVFGHQKARLVDAQMIDAWIVASPSIDEERTSASLSFIADRDRRWFRVVGLDRLCDALFANVHTGVRITETEIERMAALHGLKERKNYAGFLWPGTLTAPNPPLFRDPPTYRGSVGRRAEMDEMTRALNGKASVLTLIGVPGAGKTHLAAGVAELLTRSGRPVWWIDCGPTRSCEVSLETLLLALAHQMPSTVDRQLVADRDQPLAGRIDKALDWCDAAKLVLVLDDYDELRPDHGLDLLIRQVDQCCHAAQVVVASSHRPDYLSDPVHSLGGAYTVAVGGLGRDDVIEYLKVRSARNLLHLDLRRADPQVIWEGTGGIPVSLDRLAQLSANRSPDKVLRDAGGGEWEETARKLFEEVLNSVSPQARELAAAASVVRRGLDADFVLALAEPGAGQLLLNELVDASVLTSVDDRGFVLAGGLRQHLGDLLDDAPGLRATAHRRAMAHLLDLAARPGSDSFAHEEEALRHAAEAGEWEVLLQRAPAVVETLSHRGEYARALDQASTAQEAAERLNRARGVAYWQIEQGAILRHAGNAEESERLCRTGLEAAEALADSGLKARAYHVLGSLALAHGDHEAARGYCEAALELDRRLEDRAHEAASLARLAGLEMRQGRADRAEDLYRESLALAEQGGEDPAELARRHFDLSLVQKYDGKLDDALAHLEQARAYAGKTAKPAQMAVILGQLAEVKSRLGRHEEALRDLEESLALRGALPDPRKALITLGIRVDIYVEVGDAAGAVGALEQYEAEAAGVDDAISQAFLEKRRGLVWLLQGREAEGLALVDHACTVFRAQGREHWVEDCQATVERLLKRADEATGVSPE